MLKKIGDILHFVAKTLLYVVFVFMVFIIFVIACYVIGIQRNLKNNNYEAPLYSAYVIVSPSMHPTIKVNDAVIVKRTSAKKIKEGDIITFVSSDTRTSGITITHRVIEVLKDSDGNRLFRTKGDNNNVADSSLVKENDLSGKVIMKIPKIGYIQYFISRKYGWIIAVVIPCLGIIIYDILKIIKTISSGFIPNQKKDKKYKGKKEKNL